MIKWPRERLLLNNLSLWQPHPIRYLQMSKSGHSSESLRSYGGDLIVAKISVKQNTIFLSKYSIMNQTINF